jgi:chromosomal replication initiation ATPase DnaA
MEQISLNIIPKLQYSEGNFVLHSGVAETFAALKELGVSGFASAFVLGPERSGKTHLSMALTEALAGEGRSVQVLSGLDIPAFCYEIDSKNATLPNSHTPDSLIIDDAQSYFISVEPGGSGQFVSLYEWAKRNGVKIIILSSVPHQDYPCDNHIMSRIKASAQLEIRPPAEEDVIRVIAVLARQRGFKLQPRSIEFIRRRLGRDIGSLEKYLDRLMHLAQVLGRSIKRDLISDAL